MELSEGKTPEHARLDSLEAAVVARDRFIAAVGHELRNAIAPLAMLEELVKADADGAMLARRMELLSRGLRRLTGTVARVTDVAQLRSEKLVLSRDEVDIGAVVREVVAEAATEADAAKIELVVDAPAEPLVGWWDRTRLHQIASHLIANAIRHSGGSRVAIALGGTADRVELTVADDGRGIALDRRAHLFDAFDVAGIKRTGGLGVGLWIVHTLCREFGGSVALVEGAPPPGARVRVVLPRRAGR